MSREYILERKQTIPRPLDEVFPYFAEVANLQVITPPWLDFQYVTPLPIKMQAGTLMEYRIRICGVPVRWRTLIESFDPPVRFVDTQIKGPYQLWHHTHEFREVPGGTEMTDLVRYRIPYGPLGELARVLFVDRMLKNIFDYRYQVIERHFAAKSSERMAPEAQLASVAQ